MSAASKFGRDRFGRDLFLLAVDSPQELPSEKPIGSRYFTTLLVWDAEDEPNQILNVVCDRLLDWGGVWFGAWGSDCSRVHAGFDWAIIDRFDLIDSPKESPYIETVWHADDPVEDALWYFLWLAEPDEEFKRGCDAALVVAIGANPELVACLRNALSDPKTFCAAETAKEFPDDD